MRIIKCYSLNVTIVKEKYFFLKDHSNNCQYQLKINHKLTVLIIGSTPKLIFNDFKKYFLTYLQVNNTAVNVAFRTEQCSSVTKIKRTTNHK